MNDDKKTLQYLRNELDNLRGSLDHLRVKANLGPKEARDMLQELEARLSPAFNKAKRSLDEIITNGSEEVGTLGKSLLAGWDELRRTHRDLSREADAERMKRQKKV